MTQAFLNNPRGIKGNRGSQMIGHGEKLSRNREWAIAALLANPPIPEACRAAGIGERTMYRWLADEGFGKAYRAARRKIVQQAITQIQASIATAVQTLEAIMKDEESPASSRVPAAKTIIETGLKSLKNWKPVAGHWKMS